MLKDLIAALLEQLECIVYPGLLLVAWLLWKTWRFTVRPYFHREEVSMLPYNIPILGHAISMFKNTTELYAYAELHMIVVTNPKHKAEIYKNNEAYSYDPFINLAYKRVGNVADTSLDLLWRKVSEGFTSLHPNPKHKVLVHTGIDLFYKQLLSPGPFLDLVDTVAPNIERRLRWDNFAPTTVMNEVDAAAEPTKVVSLHRWVRDVAIGAQTCSFFGPYLEEQTPGFLTVYDQYDINSWMATYQYPDFMAKSVTVPRERVVKGITAYLDTPRKKRRGGVAYVNELEDEMRQAGLDTDTCARVLFIILWGTNSNVQLTTFWCMVHLLEDASLRAAVRAEIAPFMTATADNGEDFAEPLRLGLCESCPLLNSVFNEILRFYNTGSSVRQTTREVRIDGRRVPGDTTILLPRRHLLLAPEAFGPDAHTVDPYRFFRDKGLERHEYYEPWGQGITRCSGKAIGRFEVLSFIAWALWRYEFKVVGEGQRAVDGTPGLRVPRIDLKKPSLGMSKQVEGDDMVVEVTQRFPEN
ncbi:cytochrome P450 [Apiospora hydei]|uniref:Cytochrome P450 n=1 Tax=Apiospora hydei TaxID=1337664 RepID=A0ABR1X9J3_9PEZI